MNTWSEKVNGMTWGWTGIRGTWQGTDAEHSMSELKALGVNWIALALAAVQETAQSTAIPFREAPTVTDDEVRWAIRNAKRLGMKVCLKPVVNCANGTWRAHIGFFRQEVPGEPSWADWFESYGEFIVHYAEIAEQEGCEMLCVGRGEIFITTKVWNTDQGYDSTLRAFEASRRRLGLDVVDLYLVHWPVAGKYKDTYRALERLYRDGQVRAIGVSNFQAHHLEDLLQTCEVVPAVNQVEFHPLLTQRQLRAYCDKSNIKLQAWSPLMQGNLDVTLLNELAEKYFKTPAQIVLRWDLQHGVLTIPKSVKAERIKENADIFDFELTETEMASIDELDRHHRFGADPDNFNF